MLDPRGGSDLADEPPASPVVVQVGPEDLQGHQPPDCPVASPIHDPHPPPADLGFEVIGAERPGRGFGRRSASPQPRPARRTVGRAQPVLDPRVEVGGRR